MMMIWCYGRHLVKSIWRHNSVGDHQICIKFGRPVQNHMPMAVKRSRSKPELELQDGGCLFSETGSSNISAVAWDYLVEIWCADSSESAQTSYVAKSATEVDFRRYGRHFVKSIWRHNSVGDHPICIKFGRPVQNHVPMAVNFNM